MRVLASMVPAILLTSGAASAAVTANPLRVVLLGDSYSAGNGAGSYFGPKGCYRSSENWAERYMGSLRIVRNVTFVNRACSGGVIDDLTSRRTHETKIVSVFVPELIDKDDPRARTALDARGDCTSRYRDDEVYGIDALRAFPGPVGGTIVEFACVRQMLPQWNAVGRDTDLVMLTIGGNDVDFLEIVKQCFVVFERSPGDCRDAVTQAQDEIAAVGVRTADFLRELKGRMRADAKIMLAAYPYLEKNADFELRGGFLFRDVYAVGREVRRLGDMGDAAQRRAIDEVNAEPGARATFLDDVKSHFAGHEPDGRVCCRNDDRWLHEFDSLIPMEWYHYNATGHAEVAKLLMRRPDISIGSVPVERGNVDIAFVIDTTGSMGGAIQSVKDAAVDLVESVSARTTTARFALVDYRDFPSRTGFAGDYPAKLQQDFTTSPATISDAIRSLTLGFGGDGPETMYSGMDRAYDLTWRPGARKLMIVLADAPPLSPEPFTGFTGEHVITRSLAIDPVEAQIVDINGFAASVPELADVAARTNGAIRRTTPAQAAEEISEVIEDSLDQPYAWASGPYVGRIGEVVELDGRGSHGVASDIVRWDWDIGADGTYEYGSTQPTQQHVFTEPFDGLIGLRVTDGDGRQGLATVVGHASRDGDEIPDADDNCPDVDNRDQEDYDGDGIGDACDPTPGRPTQDREGVADNGVGGAAPSLPPGGGPSLVSPPPPVGGVGPSLRPPPPTARPRAGIRIGGVRATRDGRRLVVRVLCLRKARPCRGTIRGVMRARSSRTAYSVPAASSRARSLRVPAGARRSLLRGSRLTVRLRATAREGGTTTRTVRVRIARRR